MGIRRQRQFAVAGSVLLCTTLLSASRPSFAQAIDFYFPQGSYGYDQQLGVTVQTRAHPLYAPLGIQIGSLNVRPSVSESLFYNSNVNGAAGSGSWGSHTSGSVSVGSDWSRNSVGASLGFDHYQFLALPSESYTGWNVGLAGGYTIGDSQLLAAYSHQSFYQLSTAIGAVRSEAPIHDQTDSAGLQYSFNLGRFTVTPNVGVSAYRFGPATALGVTFNQDYLNYNAFAAGVTTRFALNEQSGILAVVQGMESSYLTTLPGQPSNDSRSVLLLGGIDYQAKGVWRYRLLGGLQVRTFSSSQIATRAAPDVEGSVIWSPTGRTTVDLTFSSTIDAPQTVGSSGYILSNGRLVVDHELKRNILLQGRGSIQYAQFLQNGTQTQFGGGVGATWLLNRALRLSLDYDIQTSTGETTSAMPTTLGAQTVPQFTQSLIALTVQIAL